MSNTIDLFMWGYQRHFQISVQRYARKLFEKIDKKMEVKFFVLGILIEEKEGRHPVCIEPDNTGYSVSAFNGVVDLAKKLEEVDEEKRIFHSHEVVQRNHDKKISNRAYVEAIRKVLKKEDFHGDFEKFISYPEYVDGFLVFSVLEVKKESLNRHYSLTKGKWEGRYKISRSFTNSVIDVFLRECMGCLKENKSERFSIERNYDEILREAARDFMYSVSIVGDDIEGLHGLYDACNSISSLRYEGAEGLGRMVVAKRNHSNVRMRLELKKPILISDFRKVRKFLELSSDDSIIVSDAARIYGLGEIVGSYNSREESLFVIKFVGHHKWEVFHENNSMMVVEYGEPNLSRGKVDRDKFYSDLKRVFLGIEERGVDCLWDVVLEAVKQKHGTMIVISDKAKEEAERLGGQSFSINPVFLSKEMIQQVTSIDGSILLDSKSVCHAIGVILDGLATDKGDSSRGARYNSAVRYYEGFGRKNNTVIIIVSEDGMVNMIPNLKPQIKRSIIEKSLGELDSMAKKDTFDRVLFNRLMNFFEDVEFYLSAADCSVVNSKRQIIQEKDKDLGVLRLMRRDLMPNSEMDESYYSDKP